MILALLVGPVWLIQGAAAPAQNAPRFAVGLVRSEINEEDRVGRKTTGMICGPDGSVRWKEANPNSSAATLVIAHALGAAGVDVALPSADLPDIVPMTPFRVVVSVLAARVDACVPQHGLLGRVGGQQTLKANGSIRIRWREIDLSTQAVIKETVMDQPFRVKEKAATLPDVILAALALSAEQFAAALR